MYRTRAVPALLLLLSLGALPGCSTTAWRLPWASKSGQPDLSTAGSSPQSPGVQDRIDPATGVAVPNADANPPRVFRTVSACAGGA